VRGRGSFEAGVADIVKSTMLWAFDFRGPLLEFWGRPLLWMEANDTHAFAGGAFEVLIFPLGVGKDLRPVGRIAVGGIVHGMALRGEVLYVAAGDGGLVVADVSNPEAPVARATLRSFGYTFGLAAQGERLYVAERSAGMRVFDISTPDRPVQVDSFTGAPWANTVAVSEDGKHVFIADGERGLIILDTSTPGGLGERATFALPEAPASRRFRPIDPPPLHVQVRDGFAYLAAFDLGLLIVDVRSPSAPKLVARIEAPGDTMDVRLQGGLAYLAQEPFGVVVVDISEPTKSRQVGSIELPGCAHSLAVTEQFVVVALLAQGAALLHLHQGETPKLVSHYRPAAEARNLHLESNLLFLAQGSGGLEIYDVSQPEEPRFIARRETRDYVFDVKAAGPRAYVAEGQMGLVVLDVSAPEQPREIDVIDTPEHAFTVSVAKQRLYTAEGMYGFAVIDSDQAYAPSGGSPDKLEGYTFTVQAAGEDRLVVADFLGGLRLLDLTSVSQPRLLWEGPRRVMRMAFDPDLLYAVTYNGRLEIFQLGPELLPVRRGVVKLPGRGVGLSVRRGLAAVAGHSDGVWLVGVNDPDRPRLLGATRTRGTAWGVALGDDWLYVADGRSGLSVVDVRNPSTPLLHTSGGH
jgi:hypothetical protein